MELIPYDSFLPAYIIRYCYIKSQYSKEKSHHTDDDMVTILICNKLIYASLLTDFVRREIFLEAVFL